MPFEDLYVSPNHGIQVKDTMISHNTVLNKKKYKRVNARDLVNGKTITQSTKTENVTYYHIELDKHSMVIANGVPAESYLDVKNRTTFTHVASA
jgi:hypothetical protein